MAMFDYVNKISQEAALSFECLDHLTASFVRICFGLASPHHYDLLYISYTDLLSDLLY
jgi:hypothetical protein